MKTSRTANWWKKSPCVTQHTEGALLLRSCLLSGKTRRGISSMPSSCILFHTHTHAPKYTLYGTFGKYQRYTNSNAGSITKWEHTSVEKLFSPSLCSLCPTPKFWEASGGTRPMMLSQPDKHITTHDLFHLTSICVITSRTRSKSSHMSHLHMTYWKSSVAVCGSIHVLKTSVYRWGLLIAYGLMWWRSVLAAKAAVLDSQWERKSQEKEGEMKEKRERGRGILHYRLIHHHRDCSSTFFISSFVLYSSFSSLNLLTRVLHLNLF